MLSEKELHKIYSWLPYQENWPIDGNLNRDNIDRYYGEMIRSISINKVFDSYYSEDGGLSNYLEFFCYPKIEGYYSGNAIQICISLCSPAVAYGPNTVRKTKDSFGWGPMFPAEAIGDITDSNLKEIEVDLNRIISGQNLILLTKELAMQALPNEVAELLESENHNEGTQVLQGVFQKID